MKIKELKAKAPIDEITLHIDSIEEPRDVRGGSLRVANATASDDTGSVVITLWNQDIDKVKTGDTIKITKGWTNEYNGSLQVSSGKFGKLEIISSADKTAEKPTEKSAKAKPAKKTEVDYAVDEDII